MKFDTRKLTTIAMLSAVSYIVMLFGRIPMVMFLKYDPKDIIVTIGGFIYGPMTAAIISVFVSLIEMFTASDTGIYGLIMNIISTCSFSCVACAIYEKKKTLKGALLGLIIATIFMTFIMLLWNYYITPAYLKTPREAVVELLIPVFLPFNLIKGSLNAALAMMIYKPVVNGLRKANLIPKNENCQNNKIFSLGTLIFSVFAVISLIMIVKIIW